MRVRYGAATDIGLVREGNEDSYLVRDPLFAVADGMGGHRGGEVASHLALETVQRRFERRAGSLTEQIEEANRTVFERSQRDRAVAGMGTTLTAALVEGGGVRLAHVGDSRAYLFRGGSLHRLTEDHTLVHRMVQEGEISEAEAERHPHRSVLTRALGTDPGVLVDERVVDVAPGDRLLLCTDGLTGMLSEARIGGILGELDDPQQAADRLVREANQAGGIDNTTVVILDFEEDAGGTSRPAATRAGAATLPDERAPRSEAPRRPGRGGTRLAIGAGIALAVIVLALVGLRLYLDSQWFVGVSDDRVAIFRGVPAEVAGLELNSVVIETPIDAEEATALVIYRDLEDGITADDREAAEAIVEQIRVDVARARADGP
ncbi:MAG TPA: Stp1/IreP family PP2C-type Ser/Thr phosphatase [Actinomycetota bacterium]|jgi:protein phosphatase|nr:Stp1/IreP family PP2C-type Ser/Thr phosphatase [Actinomycetota bacterium]